ncbi:unnamed protein product [Phytophthora lilii]|uniref:Unnamed protein product n=1 Tax=Phytophthora lilii TaxID=2077276 RepID=A0A9W6WL53_9STRA|nr:unnamed protein product [Phytophthora lilii]
MQLILRLLFLTFVAVISSTAAEVVTSKEEPNDKLGPLDHASLVRGIATEFNTGEKQALRVNPRHASVFDEERGFREWYSKLFAKMLKKLDDARLRRVMDRYLNNLGKNKKNS